MIVELQTAVCSKDYISGVRMRFEVDRSVVLFSFAIASRLDGTERHWSLTNDEFGTHSEFSF